MQVYHFGQYKHAPDDNPEIDYSSEGSDLLKEMQLAAEATKDRDCGDILSGYRLTIMKNEKRADMISDFRIRLKVDSRTRKMVFAADVHAVFDICWFTLEKKLAENVSPEDIGTSADVNVTNKRLVMSCPFCREAYIRTG